VSAQVQNCPLCGEVDHRQRYQTTDRHYGIPGTFGIVQCNSCELMFLSPMYSDDELCAMYPNDYYAYQSNVTPKRWKEILKTVLFFPGRTRDPEFLQPGKMLDLGCGSGRFLFSMRSMGWDTYGVEINSSAAELGRKIAGLNIVSGTLNEARFPDEFFDYVRANHSFEHLSCPNEVLKEIRRILKPDGKLFIGVPNVNSVNARLFQRYWWYLGAPVHPFTYSTETLKKLLTKHGFSAERVVYNSDYSGILGSAQIWLNRNNGRKSTEGAFFNAIPLRVVCHWIAKSIDLFHLGDAIEITAKKANI
jgi:SAM-dependent methyltransferase